VRGHPRQALTVFSMLVKVLTVAVIVWVVTHPGALPFWIWIPVGAMEASTGLWLLHVIRTHKQTRHDRPARGKAL
jgi:hypothetical protein